MMPNEYTNIDYSKLTQKELQLLMLKDLQNLNASVKELKQKGDLENTKLMEKVSKLETFRTQIVTALVVIQLIWGIALAIVKYII